MTDLAILLVSFLIILVGAELFTNGIEWFGRKLQLAEGMVGSVLAAVGTALPETMIPIVAIVFGTGAASHGIGIGAILGAPFMLATLAMFVTGLGILGFRSRRSAGEHLAVDGQVVRADIRWFIVAYAVAVAVAFLPAELVWPRYAVAVLLIAMYVFYVRAHLRGEASGHDDELAPLRFGRMDRPARHPEHIVPRLRIVNVQVLVALGCIVVGAIAFVGAVEGLAHTLGVDEVLLALVVAPIATELPEKANSLIWVRSGKDTLAIGNITGAMVFQSAFPVSVALVFAPAAWAISGGNVIGFASAAIAFASVAVIFGPLFRGRTIGGRRLLTGGAFYVAYLAMVLVSAGL